MRSPKLIAFNAIISLCLVIGCKKDTVPVLPLASVTVVNAMPESNPIVNMFGTRAGQHFGDLLWVYYGMGQNFAQPPTSNSLLIRPITDTAFTMFDGSLPLVTGGIYSLFLAGDTTKPDTLLTKDNIPNISDSGAAVRFVNLAIGAKSVSINLVGNDPATNTEVSNLGYLQISSFKKYIANDPSGSGTYNFEIHDKASGDLLATFAWSYLVFKSNTIVIAGSTDPGSGIALTIFPVNNY